MDFPQRFGKYELLGHIATGGMAEVFRARSFGVEGFEREICIKRMLPGLSRDPRFVQMFVREARICAGLGHPNVVQIYELGRVGDDHYMAMEFVHGHDLARVLRECRRRRVPVPVPVAVHVVGQALRGLGCAHSLTGPDGASLGVVHRDVSPHNILVGFAGETKVFDFGIAQVAERTGSRNQRAGGKAAYMSPEQAKGELLQGASDIFSAGVVLYELLAMRRPYVGSGAVGSGAEVAELAGVDTVAPSGHTRGPPDDVRHHRPEVPAEVVAVLDRMLSEDPAARFDDAYEAADSLQAAMYEAGLHGHEGGLRDFLAELFPQSRDPVRARSVDLTGLVSDVASLIDPAPPPPPTTRPEATESLEAARRPVVVLLAELTGLTDASVDDESEDIFRRHLRVLRRVRRVVDDHNGRVEQWQDDVLTVFFGLPEARDHDLERALGCAAALSALCRGLTELGLPPVELCAGVHRGEVSVGGRARRRLRYVAHGDTLKLARRLSMAAEPGEVLVSEHVARLARRRFRFEPSEPVRLRGRAVVPSFRLEGRRVRVETDAGRWLVRDDELTALQSALAELASGRGSRLAALGPAGTGKSRLLRELSSLARRRGVVVHSVRGLPYGAGDSTRLVQDLVRGLLGGGTAEACRERLDHLALDRVHKKSLGRVLGDRTGDATHAPPRAVSRGTVALVRAVSGRVPLIIAVEDTQHLDRPELEHLAQLLRDTADAPVLWWLSARTDLPASLPEPDRVLTLKRMPPKVVRTLAAQLLGADDLGPALWRAIHRSCEGNPLYVETIIGALTEQGRIQVDSAVAQLVDPTVELHLPPGLEAILAERVDRLEPELRGLLQLAACIGPDCSEDLLGAAAALPDPGPLVDVLVDRQLLREVDAGPPRRIAIASTMLGQVVHRGLLAPQRRLCHRSIAAALTRLHAPELTPHRVSLATHHAAAGEYLAAARHGVQAAAWFLAQPRLERAVATLENALEYVVLAEESGAPPVRCAHAEAVIRADLGTALVRRGELAAAQTHLQVGLELAAELFLPEIEAAANLALGRALRALGRGDEAAAHLQAAHEVAVRGASSTEGWRRRTAVEALEALSRIHHDAGSAEAERACLEAADRAAVGDDSLRGRVLLARARPALRAGDDAQGRALLDDALRCARRARDPILQGKVHNNIGILHHAAGRYTEALKCFDASRKLREGLGYQRGLAINLHNIGDTWLRLGDRGRAFAAFSDSRDVAQRMGWRRGVVMNDLFLLFLALDRAVRTGEPIGNRVDRLEEMIAEAEALGDREVALSGRLLLARSLHRVGRPHAQVDAVIESAMKEAAELDAKVLARDLQLARDAVATDAEHNPSR